MANALISVCTPAAWASRRRSSGRHDRWADPDDASSALMGTAGDGRQEARPASEFETEEEAAEYDRWFRARVQAALDDTSPDIPHDEAMARVKLAIEQAARKRA